MQRRFHILVAHEDPDVLQESVDLLKRKDYVVAGTPDPDEAYWWLSGWPIDLVVASPDFGPEGGKQLVANARAAQPEIAALVLASDTGAEPEPAAETIERRHGLHNAPHPIDSDELLRRVASLLSGITRRQRWPRKEISRSVPMRVGTSAGRLMDVSYGGLKFELGDECVLRSPVDVDFPRADLHLQVEVVWSVRGDRDGACVFGAALTPDPAPAADWRAFVDRLA
jgi:DNA-binding response OmpR family regulator